MCIQKVPQTSGRPPLTLAALPHLTVSVCPLYVCTHCAPLQRLMVVSPLPLSSSPPSVTARHSTGPSWPLISRAGLSRPSRHSLMLLGEGGGLCEEKGCLARYKMSVRQLCCASSSTCTDCKLTQLASPIGCTFGTTIHYCCCCWFDFLHQRPLFTHLSTDAEAMSPVGSSTTAVTWYWCAL
jgi:hypothetical protein